MLRIIQADITTLAVDVIVNAANPTLLGGGGVDGAIHQAAGKALLAACKLLNGALPGEAKITPGFSLPAQYVIHTVGPIWQNGTAHEVDILQQCYTRCFELAIQYQLNTIAFPAISTGAYGFPKREAAMIALKTMREYINAFDEIIACCYSKTDEQLYQKVLASLNKA